MLTSAVTSLDPKLLRHEDPGALHAELDHVSVPLLLLERLPDGSDFRIRAANNAFETQSSFAPDALSGRRLSDIIPEDQAVQIRYRLHKCLGVGAVLTLPELLTLPSGAFVREATYLPVLPETEPQRVLWAGVALDRIEKRNEDKRAYEDLRFYSADAARQIAQVTTALEAIADSPPTQQRLQPAAQTLAAICRSAEQSLGRISDRSEGLMGMAEAPAAYLTDARRLRDQEGYLSAMRDVVDDLIRLVAPDAQRLDRRSQRSPLS